MKDTAMYTRNIYKIQYTLNGAYLTFSDRMAYAFTPAAADIVEHRTLVLSEKSKTLKGFKNVNLSDLISGPYEFDEVEIIKG